MLLVTMEVTIEDQARPEYGLSVVVGDFTRRSGKCARSKLASLQLILIL